MSVIFFKFKGQRAAPEKVTFEGVTISDTELKNLIADKKGLDTTKDQYLLLNPDDKHKPYPPGTEFVRNMHVVVKREPLPAGIVARGRQQQAAADAAEADPTANQAFAAAQALASATAAAAADPNSEQAQLDPKAVRDLEAKVIADLTASAWQAQTDQQILHQRQREQQQLAQGRGRGYGRFGSRGPGNIPPICKYCGAINQHFPDECPQRYAPRTDLRQVRAPTGIPAAYVKEDESGGLLLNTGKTATIRHDAAGAASVFASLPAARKAAMLRAKAAQVPALADRPHEASDEDGLLKNLLLEAEPDIKQQQQQVLALPQQQHDAEHQQQEGEQYQQEEHAGVDAMAVDAADGAGNAAANGAAAGAAAAAGGVGDSAAAVGLFDDEDLLPPVTVEGEGGGLNLGIGMELDLQEQQQAKPLAGSPLPTQQQQQQASSLGPAKSPIGQGATGVLLTWLPASL
jgi:hypothetical protein